MVSENAELGNVE